MDERRIRRALTRREALRGAALGAAGLALLGRPGLEAFAAPRRTPGAPEGRARAVIELWMWGGPPHIDTFDPKPEAGHDVCGPLASAIDTPVPGLRLGQSLPLLAAQAERFSVIRTMTHGVNAHETAAYIMQTGREPGWEDGGVVYPSFGAVVSAFRGRAAGYEGLIPPYVVLTRPVGRFAVEGFLGLENKPFVTGGDPRRPRFAVEGVTQEGISDERQRARRGLLHELDTLGRSMPEEPAFAHHEACEERAYDLILGEAGAVFDLGREPDALRERYGRTTFGQSCLAARRLVEAGVPYVTINCGGWDTHKRHFETMRAKLAELDRGMATLLQDLDERGLLDSTIVWWAGEFGRTPKVAWEEPWNGGRHHFGACFSAVVAGGGFRGGHVVGTSDATGSAVLERPVRAHDLLGSMHELLGIDPDGPLPNPRGLDATVLPPSETGRGRGRLREIM